MVALTHVDRVGVHACANHEERLGLAADIQPFSLPHREKVGAVVRPDHLTHVRLQVEGQ